MSTIGGWLLVTDDGTVGKEVSVGGSDEQDAARRRRQRFIERLNAKEAELSESRDRSSQLSSEELEAEIEKEKQHNFSRRGFSQMA
jgi:hypothetical protein